MSTTMEDPLDAFMDYTDEYERYLTNLENSYDICLSIDFILDRLILFREHRESLDDAHCDHLLTFVVPKSVSFLCKTDMSNLYENDIINYQKQNCESYTSQSSELREFVMNKMMQYFEFIIEMILSLKPTYDRSFCDTLRDIFNLNHKCYRVHDGYFYSQQMIEECNGKYAECNELSLKQYHPQYIKLINCFGSNNGFSIILQQMLDGKVKKKAQKNDESETQKDKETESKNADVPPSDLSHHALQCYVIICAVMHRFMLPQIKQTITEYMFQAIQHWYMSMSLKSLKQYSRSQVHAILKKLYFLLNNVSDPTKRSEYISKFEYLRLEIAFKWLCTDSLEKKITAWKEFKEFIDVCQRKYDILNHPKKYQNTVLLKNSYCKNPKSVPIFFINCKDVALFLHSKCVLNLFLAEDVHEELVKKSFDMMHFLAWYNLLETKFIAMLWSHCTIYKSQSFVNTVYKVIIDLFGSLSWDLVTYVLDLIIVIPLSQYNASVIGLISNFCTKCLYRSSISSLSTTNNSDKVIPQKIAEWHCGLKLLWRAMMSESTNQSIQQLAMSKLVFCLQSDAGAVHQEYCKNLCVENLRCSRFVGTSLRVLQNIISAHPIIAPPKNENEQKNEEQKEENAMNESAEEDDPHACCHSESTRSEIIHSLQKHHGILNLFFQDLSRYMSAYNPIESKEKNEETKQNENEESESTNKEKKVQPRQIINFRARFDFLQFITQFSSLRFSKSQLDDLWKIVIGDTLKSDYNIPYCYQLEQNYFFKWLKDICPPFAVGSGNNNAISVDDAVNLFHTKLGCMPRTTMTSDSLQCLHKYFDLVYEIATKKSLNSGALVSAHPDLSAALDVMWEIAIEADTDTVAQSCGVFILSFYMKPAVHSNHAQNNVNAQQTATNNISNAVSDNILNLINNAAANVNNNNNNNKVNEQQKNVNVNKWEGRTKFVEKCMDYIQQQTQCSNFRAVHRCLDLLETFIECTRPGVMNGAIQNDADKQDQNNGNNGFGDESSSDSIIYMGDNKQSDANGVGTLTALTPNDFKKTSPWNLGKYAVQNWKLPIGINHFIKINVSNLQMQKGTKTFEVMISKNSRIGELQDLIAATLNADKNLLQMQAQNNVSFSPQIEGNTLESMQIRNGCNVTVMSIFSMQNDAKSDFIPDGAYILSQNGFYIQILLELLNQNEGNLSSRCWYLLMRLPFNLQSLSSLKDIISLIQCDENNDKIISNNVNWKSFVDASSTFKLLYSLQSFDAVLQKCNSLWLESFILLDGLSHFYDIFIHFDFDYADNVFLYASYRSLYMILKIFSSLTSHELIESDPLFTRCKPRHNTPKIIKIRSVNGVLAKFNHNELNVLTFGRKIFELILKILHQIKSNNEGDYVSNALLAEIIELALYQFVSLLFFYSARLQPLFVENDNDNHNINWINLVNELLFCRDLLIRKVSVKYLYQIFVKYNPDCNASQNLHRLTLQSMFNELKICKLNLSRHYVCFQYFEFYGLIIKYYCKNVIFFDVDLYNQNLIYFENGPLQFCWNALSNYKGLETKYNDQTDEYLLGLLQLIRAILTGFPTLKQHSKTLMRELKNELINLCLFAIPDPFENPLSILSAPKRPPIPKCQTSQSRKAAFDLLLELCKNNSLLWTEVLNDFQSMHDKRIEDIGDDIGFCFSPFYMRRSNTNLSGLFNYGCTCYMNATMQQLFCNPVIRKVVLGVDLRQMADYKKSVIYSLQTMFCRLQWSDRRAVWPEDFLANYRDFEGNKIDPNEQMDAHEFFNFLFDCLERELKGSIAEQILKNEFCGKEVNQVICQECGYVSETFVPMYAVSCKIANHQTLEESLKEEFVRGDWLKGGNAYKCSKCDKKVTALKRSCFDALSNTMLVHLQRFEFNLETMLKVKINSKLQFPMDLNMKQYTKEWLDAGDNEELKSQIDDAKYEYELCGITVHSGMADIGHYYSFIRQQFDDGSLGKWYSFNDDFVSLFDLNTMSDKCFGGNKLTLIRDANTNQLSQRWIPKSNNAYILVYRRKNIEQKIENMQIENEYLALKEHKLTDLKANNGKPLQIDVDVEVEMTETNQPKLKESETELTTETKTSKTPQPIVKEPEEERVRDPDLQQQTDSDVLDVQMIETNATTTTKTSDDIEGSETRTESVTKMVVEEPDSDEMDLNVSVDLADDELNALFVEEENAHKPHLYDIAESVHWSNTRFMQKCQLCDLNFVSFKWQFFALQPTAYCDELPLNRHKSANIRRQIGSARTKLILCFVWDILCKFESATKIESNNNNGKNWNESAAKKRAKLKELKQKTLLFEWCNLIKSIFQKDASSAYQFLYILSHSNKRIWTRYLLECKVVLVRECLLDCIFCAILKILPFERPLYYVKEQDVDDLNCSEIAIQIDRNKKDEKVKWFESGSVIVALLDEMCKNILFATHYWRFFNEFWLFFLRFAELGNAEKQLLLDRHLVTECYRFYHNKRPFEYGLKQLIFDEDDADIYDDDINDDDDDDQKNDHLTAHRVKYDRRRMGSNDADPDCSNMSAMLAAIICSCAPPSFARNGSFDSLPPTMEEAAKTSFCILPIADRRILNDSKIWMKFLEDGQNPNALAKIICHFAWKNNEYSRKTMRNFVGYIEEYNDNVYKSLFVVLRRLFAMNDFREEETEMSMSEDEENEMNEDENDKKKFEIRVYAHFRIEKFLVPIIKMLREWYRENKYPQSVAKIAQFIDECAQTNEAFSSYFRIKSADVNVCWFQQFLNSHSYYLTLPKPPEFE